MYNKIMNYVAEMVEDFETIEVIYNDEYFGYNTWENKIYVTELETDEDFDNFMINYLKEEFNIEITKEQLPIFNMLHEIGHKETRDKIDYDTYVNEISIISPDDYLRYRQVFAEYLADNWAACFIEAFGIENL
jgi:hypothetical protein